MSTPLVLPFLGLLGFIARRFGNLRERLMVSLLPAILPRRPLPLLAGALIALSGTWLHADVLVIGEPDATTYVIVEAEVQENTVWEYTNRYTWTMEYTLGPYEVLDLPDTWEYWRPGDPETGWIDRTTSYSTLSVIAVPLVVEEPPDDGGGGGSGGGGNTEMTWDMVMATMGWQPRTDYHYWEEPPSYDSGFAAGFTYANSAPSGEPSSNNLRPRELRQLRDIYGAADARWRTQYPSSALVGAPQLAALGAPTTPFESDILRLNLLLNVTIPTAVSLHNSARDPSLQVTVEDFDLAYPGHLQYVLIVDGATHLTVTWLAAAISELAIARGAGSAGLADANFAQIGYRASGAFSAEGQALYTVLAGRTIVTVDDLAQAIVAGQIPARLVVVDYVLVGGQRVILNTRTSAALRQAGIPKSEWVGRNVTGTPVPGMPGVIFDDLARAQTIKSGLPPTGTSQAP